MPVTRYFCAVFQITLLLVGQADVDGVGGVSRLPAEQVDQFSSVISRNGLYGIISVLALAVITLFALLLRQREKLHVENQKIRDRAQAAQETHAKELLAVVSEQTKAITRQVTFTEAASKALEKAARVMQTLRKTQDADEEDA
jgi:cell division septation protein DedD